MHTQGWLGTASLRLLAAALAGSSVKGLTIGDYAIGDRVGSGGVGDVFRGTDLMLEREVAVKFLRPGLGAQPELVERFRSEARTLAQLNHANIATLYALHREGDTLAMVMEFVDGKTVSTLLRDCGPLPVGVALTIFLQALDGIGCAHANGVVHRDLKPSNLMLDRRGVVKVMDFGIARYVGASRITRAGSTLGTAQYMAPEQVRGSQTDARSDIYSLCIVLYEMLTDRLPFEGEVEYEVMRAHVEVEPMPPRELRPEIPEAIERAVLRGLHKDPEQRFASTEELRAVLIAALGSTPRVSAVELGELAARPQRKQPGGAPSDTCERTELLLIDPIDTPASSVAARSAASGAQRATPAAGQTSTVWELPDTARHTHVPRTAQPVRPEPAARRRRISPSVLQVVVMALVALSVGVPNAVERPRPIDPGAPLGTVESRLRSVPLLDDPPGIELNPLWLPPSVILPLAQTEDLGIPAPRARLAARTPRPAAPAATARTRPAPKPKPASLSHKAQLVRADEEEPRPFNEGDEEKAEPGTSEWMLRR